MGLVDIQELKSDSIRITLNDPDNLNAMSEDMADEFLSVVQTLEKKQNSIRAIVLTGSGRAFSAGGNLNMLEAKVSIPAEENKKLMLKFYNSFLSIIKLKVPLIAAINGHAVGAGLCLASACDIRVCSPTAKLGFSFTKLGLHPGMGATYFLPKIIGDSLAREMLFTGRIIEAAQALKIGLVSQVSESLDTVCEEIISEVSLSGPKSISLLAESLRSYDTEKLNAALEREAICQAYSYSDNEFKEGVRAAIEKRKANFSLS